MSLELGAGDGSPTTNFNVRQKLSFLYGVIANHMNDVACDMPRRAIAHFLREHRTSGIDLQLTATFHADSSVHVVVLS